MGRTHANAYRKVNHFFDVPYKPVLKTICGLVEDEAKAFAEQWGFESHTTDYKAVLADGIKFDGFDIFLYHPHFDIDAGDDETKRLAGRTPGPAGDLTRPRGAWEFLKKNFKKGVANSASCDARGGRVV